MLGKAAGFPSSVAGVFCIPAPACPPPIGWPRIHADCDFKYPLRFEDTVEVHLLVREKTERTIAYTVVFRKLNGGPAREVARGTLTVACVTSDPSSGKLKSVPIPAEIAGRIEVAPGALLE